MSSEEYVCKALCASLATLDACLALVLDSSGILAALLSSLSRPVGRPPPLVLAGWPLPCVICSDIITIQGT